MNFFRIRDRVYGTPFKVLYSFLSREPGAAGHPFDPAPHAVFLRDPVERFRSCYANKISDMERHPVQNINKELYQVIHGRPPENPADLYRLKMVTPTEVIRLLADKRLHDVHWKPQVAGMPKGARHYVRTDRPEISAFLSANGFNADRRANVSSRADVILSENDALEIKRIYAEDYAFLDSLPANDRVG